MNIDDVMSSSCELFRKGKFSECCEFLQSSVDDCHLKNISLQNEVEFIVLRNNLLVCNCLRVLTTIDTEYVGKMSELLNVTELYLYEKHVPLELRVNFVCNALHWYWWKPTNVPDYCYNKIMTLTNECLHQVLHENGNSVVNLSSLVDNEEDILNSLEHLSNRFLSLKPILVVQCLEISQILLLVFLSRCSFASLLVHFTVQFLDKIKTIMVAFKHKKCDQIANCFKLGLTKINVFLEAELIRTVVVSSHVSLCIMHVLENQHRQALCTLSTVDQHLDSNDDLYCLVCYLKALLNFNLKEFEVTLYYLSEMCNCLMEPLMNSRYFLLLGRTHSKMGNSDSAITVFEKLKETKFNKIMAYYMSQHYELNGMQFTQMMVLENALKENYDIRNDRHEDTFNSYTTRVLTILHPQPDLTRRQLLYMAAKKKYEYSSYKVSASDYLDLLRSNEEDHNVSNLVTVPTNFMLQHEAVVVLIKAQEIEEAFKLCQSLIGEFEPGCGLWKSDLFWADELNDYNFNVLGTMLLAETGLNKNTETVLEALNKSYNCLYAKISCDYPTETDGHGKNIKILRQILMGKILLLKATVLSRLNNDEDCEAAFKKAITFNAGDEDIVYLYSKWLEHKGKFSQSLNVRDQFDRSKINTVTCDNLVMSYILENKHGLEDSIIGKNVMDDLFVSTDERAMDIDNEMDPADDDIFNDLFVD